MAGKPTNDRTRLWPAAGGVLLSLLVPPVPADVPPEQEHEVAHLLAFVRYADCQMIRNGTTHDSREGYRHMLDKYDYFRDRIQTTEQFIDLAATKSLLSGKRYQVACPGATPEPSADWLRRELTRYRACVARGLGDCGEGAAQDGARR